MNRFKKYWSIIILSIFVLVANPVELQAQDKNPINSASLGNLAQKYSNKVSLKPGVFLEERQELYAKIETAKRNGVGVKNYLAAFKYVESMVASGAREEDIAKRIDSISNGLDEQFKRSKILKIQKLPPPIAASSPPPSAVHTKSNKSFSKFNSANKGDLVNKIKDKWFGGEIPDSIKKKIPAGIDPNKLNKNDLDRLMQRLGK